MSLFDALNRVFGPEQKDTQAGYDTAKAWQGVQQRLNQQYEQQGNKALENTPLIYNNDVLQGIKAKAMDVGPVQRWQDQINAMMTSGNPMLQKAALQDVSNAYGKQIDMAKPDHPNTYKEWLRLPPKRRAELSYEDFLNSRKPKMYESAMDAPVKDYEKWAIEDPETGEMRTPTPADAKTVGQLYALNPVPRTKETMADYAKIAGLSKGAEYINMARDLLFDKDGNMNEDMLTAATVIDALHPSLRSIGKYLYEKIPGVDPKVVDQAAQFLNYFDTSLAPLLRAETGAAATNDEIATMKLRFMPKASDGPELAAAKMQAYIELSEAIVKYSERGTYKQKIDKDGITISQANAILDKHLAKLEKPSQPAAQPITQLPEGWRWDDGGEM